MTGRHQKVGQKDRIDMANRGRNREMCGGIKRKVCIIKVGSGAKL